jgi:PPOX class probable F420-dependent enzyme
MLMERPRMMERRRLTPREISFLTHERVVRAATAAPDGTPHVVPVCHAVERGLVYFGSAAANRKIRNLRRRGRVSLVADRYTENWGTLRGVVVTGRAQVFARGPVFERGRRLLYRKYRQYQKVAALEPGESVVVRVTPTHVMSWRTAG